MIGQLRGKLIEKQPPMLMLDVGGVGYLVQAPLSTFFTLPELGQEITLRTHMVIREDAQLLFGFATLSECRLFQEVIKINGVGPKIALAILSGLSPQEFMDVIVSQNVNLLQRIPGIGGKTAQRIMVEMQTTMPKFQPMTKGEIRLERDPKSEAIAALVSLGYKPLEATQAVTKVKNIATCEHIIKEALQGLAKV